MPATASATYPGANGKIAFDLCPFCNLIAVEPDGTNSSDPAPGWDGWQRAFPAWAPSGGDLAFGLEQFEEEGYDLYTLGGQGAVLNSGDIDSAWSPDGQVLLFESAGVLRRLEPGGGWTQIATAIEQPEWKPDGSKIAFVRSGDIWQMNPDGSGQAPIANTAASESDPSFAPDSSRIAFTRDGNTIWVMDANGGSETSITSGDDPVWSPDGRQIAFIRAWDAWTMNADGTGQTQITTYAENADGVVADLSWQPLHALDPFPRPGGGTPLRVPLVPAYRSCASPNTTHAPPLDRPSCTPPGLISNMLTTSSVGRQNAFARLTAQPGNTTTPADEADIAINVSASDVRCADTNAACPAGADSDFDGKLLMRAAIRSTDRSHGYGGVSATSEDTRIELPFECTPTADPNRGSACAATSSADALLPGLAVEGKRSVLSAFSVVVRDPGPNGSGYGAGCPPACGDGDESEYLRQGVFFGS